jgi:hypothetical protein
MFSSMSSGCLITFPPPHPSAEFVAEAQRVTELLSKRAARTGATLPPVPAATDTAANHADRIAYLQHFAAALLGGAPQRDAMLLLVGRDLCTLREVYAPDDPSGATLVAHLRAQAKAGGLDPAVLDAIADKVDAHAPPVDVFKAVDDAFDAIDKTLEH